MYIHRVKIFLTVDVFFYSDDKLQYNSRGHSNKGHNPSVFFVPRLHIRPTILCHSNGHDFHHDPFVHAKKRCEVGKSVHRVVHHGAAYLRYYSRQIRISIRCHVRLSH